MFVIFEGSGIVLKTLSSNDAEKFMASDTTESSRFITNHKKKIKKLIIKGKQLKTLLHKKKFKLCTNYKARKFEFNFNCIR